MPKLGQFTTSQIELPSTSDSEDKAFVEVKTKLNLGDSADLYKVENEMDRTILGLTLIIVNWNYTEDGTPDTPKLPINESTVRQLDPSDFVFLANKLTEMREEQEAGLSKSEQKVLPSGSGQAETPTPLPTSLPISVTTE